VPTRVYFLDPETMSVIRSSTAPPCLEHIVRDVGHDGFLGTFGWSPPQIGRFDARGVLTASVSFQAPQATQVELYSTSLSFIGVPPRAIVATLDSLGATAPSYMFITDLNLRFLGFDTPLDNGVREVSSFSADSYFVMDDARPSVLLFGVDTGVAEQAQILLADQIGHFAHIGQ